MLSSIYKTPIKKTATFKFLSGNFQILRKILGKVSKFQKKSRSSECFQILEKEMIKQRATTPGRILAARTWGQKQTFFFKSVHFEPDMAIKFTFI